MTARDQFAHELRELITPLGHGGQKEIAERVVNTRDRRSLVVRFSRTSAELERALTRRAQALEKRISTWLQGRAPNKNSDLDAVIDAIAGLTKPPIPHQRRKELKTRLHQLRSKARGEPATPRRSTTPVQPDGGEDVGFGAPAVERDPIQTLGVHQAIRVTSSDRGGQAIENSSTLPAYLERDHDGQLRAHLQALSDAGRPRLVIVTGNSCAGKTRTLYQAVCGTALRDWFIATPQTPARITALLADPQVLTNTIVWLDELQKLLPATAEGDAAARAVIDLLNRTNEDGPVALLATIWPSTNGNYNILMPATRLWATT